MGKTVQKRQAGRLAVCITAAIAFGTTTAAVAQNSYDAQDPNRQNARQPGTQQQNSYQPNAQQPAYRQPYQQNTQQPAYQRQYEQPNAQQPGYGQQQYQQNTQQPGYQQQPASDGPAAPPALDQVPGASNQPRQEVSPHYNPNGIAVLRGLDKITGRVREFEAPVGEVTKFFRLEILPRTCYSRPPTETPETSAFLEITDLKLNGRKDRIFTGWMFASSPAVNALEHPVYDVWVINCKTP